MILNFPSTQVSTIVLFDNNMAFLHCKYLYCFLLFTLFVICMYTEDCISAMLKQDTVQPKSKRQQKTVFIA